jgi:hypothetical protein
MGLSRSGLLPRHYSNMALGLAVPLSLLGRADEVIE